MKNIASYFGINAQKLQRHYKHQVSGYHQWDQLYHSQEYLIYPDNITSHLSIDELSLSKGELYTLVTNKNIGMKNKKSIVAIINGTQSKVIEEVLKKISIEKRSIVKEVTMDMARNMASAVDLCFPLSTKVIDRFHAVKLVMDAMQHVRISLRWQAIDDENKAVKEAKDQKRKYKPEILSNGDTIKELLARSRYLLYTLEENWTANQDKRATILFEKYPTLQTAYKLTLMFRGFYKSVNKEQALKQFIEWKTKVIEAKIEQFNTVVHSLEYHLENILNFFDNRNANANAESFNSKIKVSDVQFFLFWLQKLFA